MENKIATLLLEHKEGSTKAYNALLSYLDETALKDDVLAQFLLSLNDCVGLLGRQSEHLVGVVLRTKWIHCSPNVVSAFQDFVVHLVSAKTMFLTACLRMIVRQFMPECKEECSNEDREMHSKGFAHLHMLLRRVMKIVPVTGSVLIGLIMEYFPYLNRSSYEQACYVHNLLTLTTYSPDLRSRILELIVAKIMKLDVHSPRQKIEETQEESDDDDEEEEMDIFELEEDKKSIDKKSEEKKAEQRDENAESDQPRPMTLKEADSLDRNMFYIFSYIHNTCYQNGELDWEATKKLYRELLIVFDKIILPTHASSHVQYIMFYICSFRDLLAEGFLDYLWKKVCNPSTQPIFRNPAVAYMSSLLARAKYIPISTVKDSLDVMVTWTHSYIRGTAESFSQADVGHHGPFYSVCQAIFYVFAFRHKQLLALPKGFKYCQSLNLQTIVTSRLNPLRVCLPVVSRIFSATARHHQLCYCDSIMEKNRRQALPEAAPLGGKLSTLTHMNPLDSFFPFDPYLLVRSERFIKPLYQEFEGSVVVEDSEEEVDDFEEAMEDEARIDLEHEHSLSAKGRLTATSPTDLVTYGISPGFKHLH